MPILNRSISHRAESIGRRERLGRRGADRDVSGRGIGAPGRGHHGGIVEHAGVALDGFGPQQEDLDREAIHAYSRDRFFSGGDNRKSREVSLMRLNAMSAASVAILLSLVFLDSASAEGGCGPGFHRTPYGRCRPNEGPVVVAPAAPVVVAPAAPVVVAPAPVVCRGGFRWHPRLRRCVVL